MGDLPGFWDFTRPGNDMVDDNLYHPFIRFWRRYARHFTRLLAVNALYALVTLPVFVWIVSLVNAVSTDAGSGVVSILGAILLSVSVNLPAAVLIALMVLSIVLMGPATAALSCATLNCAWDRPGMFWMNFWSAWKENWKQALPFGVVDALACFVTLYYLVDATAVFGAFGSIMKILWCVMMLIYGMVRVYLYPIMVTVELPTGALIRNCMILSVLKLWRPLVVMLIAAVLSLLCIVADILLVPCFIYSFVAFCAAFFTQPMIDRYLIHPEQYRQEENETDDEIDEEIEYDEEVENEDNE